MAGKALLTIGIEADASDAASAFDKATGSVKEYGDAASTAAKQSRDISGGIEDTGDAAANVTTGLRDLGGAMSEMDGIVGTMGTSMVAASVAFEAMDGAATLYKGAQALATKAAAGFNTVLKFLRVTILTNPIFIIAAIILAIGVALVVAYKKCETFRRIVDNAFKAVNRVIQSVWNWIKNNWPTLLAILTGPIGIAVLVISRNWDSIKRGAQFVISFIRSVWSSITNILTSPFESAWNAISSVFSKIKNGVQSIIDAIGRIKMPSIDLNPFKAFMGGTSFAAPAVRGQARAPSAQATTASGTTVIVNGALDPDRVARQIKTLLANHDRRIGGRTAAVGLP